MVGISFHVGSGCMDPPVYRKAIKAARKLFDFAQLVGYDFKLLDIGGGFPGDKFTTIEQVCCKFFLYFVLKITVLLKIMVYLKWNLLTDCRCC